MVLSGEEDMNLLQFDFTCISDTSVVDSHVHHLHTHNTQTRTHTHRASSGVL